MNAPGREAKKWVIPQVHSNNRVVILNKKAVPQGKKGEKPMARSPRGATKTPVRGTSNHLLIRPIKEIWWNHQATTGKVAS